MPKIYERNPDTDEVRSYERVKPSPYRNEMAEAVEILERMNDKLDRLLEQQKKHLEEGHPRDDGK